jgi:hypothetical protein
MCTVLVPVIRRRTATSWSEDNKDRECGGGNLPIIGTYQVPGKDLPFA